MLYPGKEKLGNSHEELIKKADQTLAVDLPTLKHIGEPKALISDGQPAFVVMAEHKRTCI